MEQTQNPFDPKEYVMYFQSITEATIAYHFEQFKYRRTDIRFGIVDLTDSMYAVLETDLATQKGWNIINPPELGFENLDFEILDEIPMNTSFSFPSFWSQLDKALAFIDNDLLIFIVQSKLPLDLVIRHYLYRSHVSHENRFIGKQDARDSWNPQSNSNN